MRKETYNNPKAKPTPRKLVCLIKTFPGQNLRIGEKIGEEKEYTHRERRGIIEIYKKEDQNGFEKNSSLMKPGRESHQW